MTWTPTHKDQSVTAFLFTVSGPVAGLGTRSKHVSSTKTDVHFQRDDETADPGTVRCPAADGGKKMSDEQYLHTLIITVNVTHPALVSLRGIVWDF